MGSELERDLENAAQALLRSKYCIALTGAGMSTESGIPDFRGPQGIWTRFGEPDMRGYQRFLEDPRGWWESRIKLLRGELDSPLRELYIKAREAKPNPGHYALAKLESMGILKCIITQNVDGLHQAAGSRNVLEIHGNLSKLRCIRCGSRYYPKGAEMGKDLPSVEIHEDDLPPKCPSCGGIIKTDGVMFGEPIPRDVLSQCILQAKRCDCMLVAGTSATVYPAASLPRIAKDKRESLGWDLVDEYSMESSALIIEVNLDETPLTHTITDIFLRGRTGEILPRLVEYVEMMSSRNLRRI